MNISPSQKPVRSLHPMWKDLRHALMHDHKAQAVWEDSTPLARNEWICWMTSAKQEETKQRRLRVGLSKMRSGMRRPCCWAGCPHRKVKKKIINETNKLSS